MLKMHRIDTILLFNETTLCKPGHVLRHRSQGGEEQKIYTYLIELTLVKQVELHVL